MFELYIAHLSAKPAQGSVFRATVIKEGIWYGLDRLLPPSSVFKVKPGRGWYWVQVRTNLLGYPYLPEAICKLAGEVLEFHLVDESELNSD